MGAIYFGIIAVCRCFARRVKWFLPGAQGEGRKALIRHARATVHGVVFDVSAIPPSASTGGEIRFPRLAV
jgi:hypothetical protein